jgi:hypothetical protein
VDARAYFLMLHSHVHGDVPGSARRILNEPTPEQMRITPPGHNSIAWCVWHIARGADWVVAVLGGGEQVLTRDGWDRRLCVPRPAWAMGTTAAEVAELNTAIDLGALHGYYDAVRAETRRCAQTLDFDALAVPVDAAARRRALELLGAAAGPVREHLARWPTKQVYLNVMTLTNL